MNIDLLVVGKTDSAEIQSLVATYLKRLNFYTRVTLVTLPDLKNTRNISAESQKRQEGELLMRQFADGDYVVLLDEKGAEMRSVEFSMWLQKRMNSGVRRLCFVIGGPYGFSKTVYDRADESISLSRMTSFTALSRSSATSLIITSRRGFRKCPDGVPVSTGLISPRLRTFG